MTNLNEELELLKDYILTLDFIVYPNDERWRGNYPREDGVQLRLDFEIPREEAEANSKEYVVDKMLFQVRGDLEDLIENGDKDQINDPLCKAMDGSKKLNKTPSSVTLSRVFVFREHSIYKDTFEYTMYLTLGVEWEDEDNAS